jgi:hypothetical protein
MIYNVFRKPDFNTFIFIFSLHALSWCILLFLRVPIKCFAWFKNWRITDSMLGSVLYRVKTWYLTSHQFQPNVLIKVTFQHLLSFIIQRVTLFYIIIEKGWVNSFHYLYDALMLLCNCYCECFWITLQQLPS